MWALTTLCDPITGRERRWRNQRCVPVGTRGLISHHMPHVHEGTMSRDSVQIVQIVVIVQKGLEFVEDASQLVVSKLVKELSRSAVLDDLELFATKRKMSLRAKRGKRN